MIAGIMILLQGGFFQAVGTDVTLDAICRDYPEKIIQLFHSLDLDRPGLEAVKAAADRNDWPGACQALLDYYMSSAWAARMRMEPKPPTQDRDASGDAILDDVFTLYTVSAKTPRRPDGGLDWTYNGPGGDKEWGWGLNRHPWIATLLDAYARTGNPIYIQGFDGLIRDWITSNPYPGEKNSTPQWRGLEVFCRVSSGWPTAFYRLQDMPEFSPAARILMLSSIPDHAHYNRHFHAQGGNWITMELRGLASAAVYWPEFKEADGWFEYAMARLTPELTNQVYPDGAQKELSSLYHRAALNSFDGFMQLASIAGRQTSPEFRACIESMYNYLAYTMNPAGNAPLNHDSDVASVRADVLAGADAFVRADWAYVATNGAQGEAPEGLPSRVFPWAGHFIMRSGWDADAQWAFFETGPLGTGHWHLDKLHLSVMAYGRDILVDSGRFTYQAGPWRAHFVGSESHNVILVDGHGQKSYEPEAREPMNGNYSITPEYDFVRGIFDAGYEGVEDDVTHTRAVFYARGAYWLVVDRIAASRPHEIAALWHFHPQCTVASDGLAVATTDEGKGNIRIVPTPEVPWRIELVTGRETPRPQGWWSREYNVKGPSTCAVYSVRIERPETFAWLIIPGKGAVTDGSPTILESDEASCLVRVVRPAVPEQTVRIPLANGGVVSYTSHARQNE